MEEAVKKLTKEQNNKIVAWKKVAESKFNESNWRELGTLTNCYEVVDNHPRLLRSYGFGDPDYPGNVLDVLRTMLESDGDNEEVIESYIDDLDLPSGGVGATENKIVCRPTAFKCPTDKKSKNLVAVMMPFAADFSKVYKAIKEACEEAGFTCKRVDEIWNESVVMQDVFDLIYQSWIVIVDFSGKNPNVMYETGIAHTLGRHVIPISQSKADVPFDLQHHRYLSYLSNIEGLEALKEELETRLTTIGKNPAAKRVLL